MKFTAISFGLVLTLVLLLVHKAEGGDGSSGSGGPIKSGKRIRNRGSEYVRSNKYDVSSLVGDFGNFNLKEPLDDRRLEKCRRDIKRKNMSSTLAYLGKLGTKEAKLAVLNEVYQIWGDDMPASIKPVYDQFKSMYEGM
ncbi:uncharacterized protein LOC116350649 [Contarinia nasturtii]|uniref:uncharacterized protein LOC116350649 n=1 Tax=Contarinia nasturtii TaxID=265458 RepID=UPI0012D4B915|nr:uncharacterized protein LOC116350649 [Contarinia nasturtii]